MEKLDNQSSLPKVEQADLLALMSEEILDANHMERWDHFSQTNPALAQEILMRAHVESTQSAHFDENSAQLQKRIIDTVTFTVRALEAATTRHQAESKETTDEVSTIGVDDEGQPLST